VITQDQIDEWEESESYYSGIEPETRDHSPQGRRNGVANMTVSEMVKEFAKVTGQEPDGDLYRELIVEEYTEWWFTEDSDEEELKELSDLVYVIFGYASANGWDLETAVRRVHENNIGRCIQPDGTIKRRDDGKVIKNKDYPKVNLSDLV